MISVTLAIVILTVIISITAFSNQKVVDDLIFYPPAIKNQNQWYRFLSCALIHADITHLAFNMITFYSFGKLVEGAFTEIFHQLGPFLYIAVYVISQILCLIPTYFKNQNNYSYRSLGASGAVSAVVFAGIILSPLDKLYILFVPIGVPGFIYGIIFLAITYYLDKQGKGGINHSAHLWGAVAGIILLVIFCYTFGNFDAIANFVYQLKMFAHA